VNPVQFSIRRVFARGAGPGQHGWSGVRMLEAMVVTAKWAPVTVKGWNRV
jgi:hypothetical protein